MELFYSGLSDAGNVRSNNEDYLFAGKIGGDEYLFIVADGMGGHSAGEIASRKAVTVFVRQLEKSIESNNGHNIAEELRYIVLDVNETLIREGSKHPGKSGMGTTLSAFYIKGDRGYIAHVGDSRIYRYANSNPASDTAPDTTGSPGQLTQLTEDHSIVGKLLKNGFITEEEARSHPQRNVIYQSIGLRKEINVQVMDSIPIKKGQKYLLCSDGLYGVVPSTEIRRYLTGTSTLGIAGQLIKRAKENGGPDNISVIVVSTEEDKEKEVQKTIDLADTMKIVDSYAALKKMRRRKIGFFILLGLLILLLAALIYILVIAVGSDGLAQAGVESRHVTVSETPFEWLKWKEKT